MLAYIIAFVLSISAFYLGQQNKGMTRNVLFILGLLPTVLIAGLRDISIGTDTSMYPIHTFNNALRAKSLKLLIVDSELEELYVLLAYISAKIVSHINSLLFFSHLIILLTILYAFRIFKINIALAFIFFYLLNFADSLNASRQYLSMPFGLLSLAYFVKKKYLWSLIFMIVAYGFHHTAPFFLSLHGLYYLSSSTPSFMRNKATQIFVVVGVVSFMIFFKELLYALVGFGIAEEKYYERYGSSSMYGSNVPISLFSLAAYNLFLFYWLKPKMRDKFVIFTKYVIMLSFLLCFTGLISTFAARLSIYYFFTSIIGIVYIMMKHKYQFVLPTLAFYVFYWFMVVCVANLGDTYPYKSIILNEILGI